MNMNYNDYLQKLTLIMLQNIKVIIKYLLRKLIG